jgi:hypothetical protein
VKLPNAVPKPKVRRRKPKTLTRTRMKSRGPRTKKSGGHLFPKLVNEAYREFIRAQPCILAGRGRVIEEHATWARAVGHFCFAAVRACHVKARGAGGPDMGNLYPACDAAHDEQHAVGIPTFEKQWEISLPKIAEQLHQDFLKSGGSGDPNP